MRARRPVTAMSPLQFQKRMRLQEARRLCSARISTPQAPATAWVTATPRTSPAGLPGAPHASAAFVAHACLRFSVGALSSVLSSPVS